MSTRQISRLPQPRLEVVVPTPAPRPPPKIFVRGPPRPAGLSWDASIPNVSQRQAQSPLLQRHLQLHHHYEQPLPPLTSAWSESPTSDRGGELLFPSTRGSPWPLLSSTRDGSTPYSQRTAGRRSEKRAFEVLARKRFWLVCGPLFVLLVLGLAVGLGLGLAILKGDGRKGHGANGDAEGDGNAHGHEDETSTATPAAPTPTPSPLVLAPRPIECPAANGTAYQVPNSSPGSGVFMVLCDVSYNEDDAVAATAGTRTIDIRFEDTESIEECIDACAASDDCVGADWGKRDGRFTCWMKGSLGPPAHEPGWLSVVKKEGRDVEKET